MTTPSTIITKPTNFTVLSTEPLVGLDVEVFVNFFCVGITNFKDYTHTFIFDKHQDDRQDLIWLLSEFDKRKTEVVSFNGIHYDNPVLNWVRSNPTASNEQIKQFSDFLIDTEDWWKYPGMKTYKWMHKWVDVDLYLYWSRMLRLQKKISLKGLGVQLQYPVIQELPVSPSEPVPDEMRNEVIVYNSVHDLGILRYLLTKKFNWQGKSTTFPEMIELRRTAIKKYNLPRSCMSWDAVKLGLSVTLSQHEEELEPPRYFDTFEEIISSKIYFQSPEFSELLEKVKRHRFNDPLHFSVSFLGTVFEMKQGGLHSKNKPAVYGPKPGYIFHSLDVSGYYPSLAEALRCKLHHQLASFKNQRIDLKHRGLGKSPEANLLKLAANGSIGNFNQENSPAYDPYSFFSITINGQLFLLMLIEWLAQFRVIPVMANTDGFEVYVPENYYSAFLQMCSLWEQYTGFELEHFKYNTVWLRNVNSYLGLFEDGTVKEKGWFVTNPDLGNRVDFLALPKAMNAFLLQGKPFTQTFKELGIYDFCGAQKVDRSYQVYLGNERLRQRLNVYYASKSGSYLFKSRNGKKSAIAELKKTKVKIFNVFEPGPYDVNYTFYEKKLQKILAEMGLGDQLKLL